MRTAYYQFVMDFTAIRYLVAGDFQQTDRLIEKCLDSRVDLISQIGAHITQGGGKRLRPLLTLLCAKALDYLGDNHIKLAAIIELIHTATLLHDDVVDASTQRRGQDTANTIWGNTASVLTGDFLYSRTFELMVDIGDMEILRILAATSNQIAEGEMLQLLNCHRPETSEADYLTVIENKTAKLFEAACLTPAVLAGCAESLRTHFAQFGMYLGITFQLVDDILDYTASAEQMGKNLGDDLREGKPTLPLIYALTEADAVSRGVIEEAIKQGSVEQLKIVQKTIQQTGAIDYTRNKALHYAQLAVDSLQALPSSDAQQAMMSLAKLSVTRSH